MRSSSLMVLLCIACAPAAPATEPSRAAAEPPPRATEHDLHEHDMHDRNGHHPGHGPDGYHKDFSDAAGFAARFDDPARDAWQRPSEVMDHLRIEPGSVVVDLGAGTGYFIAALSQRVGPSGKVLALDVEPEMVAFLARRARENHLPNVEARQVAADDPGLPAGGVARILIVNTWHHIDDRSAYARRLAAALAPGGEIWVVDFTPESDLGPPAEHRVSAARVVEELEAAGLGAEIVEPEGLPKQYLVRAFGRR